MTLARPLILPLFLVALVAAPAAAQLQFDPSGGAFGVGGGEFGFDPLAGEVDTADLVKLGARFAPAGNGAPAMIEVTAKIAEGYHIFSVTQPPGGPQRTSLKLNAPSSARLAGPWVADPAPKTHVDQEIWVGLPIEEHFGTVTWRAPIELPAGVDPATLTVSGVANMQACTETACHAIDGATFTAEQVEPGAIPFGASEGPQPTQPLVPGESPLTGTATSPPPKAVTLTSLLPILGAAFVGGLILNLMPCVLPVIGLKVLSFAEQAGHQRGKVLAMNLAYTAGLMSVFILLAALAAFAGYGWGELFTYGWFKIGMVVFVFAMALSFLGVWEIPIPGFAGGRGANKLQQKEGYAGAFFKGVFTTVLATPCSGPFLGPAIGFTLGQPTAITFLIFGAIGLGMASPYLLIGVFPSLVKSLPKPGAWMETFKQLMGFVLMATVVYLVWLVSEEQRMPMLATLVAVAFACWWIGSTPITASTGKKSTAWLGGLATAGLIGIVAFTQMGPSDYELAWRPFTPEKLSAAKTKGETILVDFTANWCATCQVNSRLAINTQRVKQVVEANNVTPLLADWSDRGPAIRETLEAFGSRSIPFLAIFPADRPNEPILLPDLITERQLLEALAEAGATQSNAAATVMPEIEIGEATSATFR
ncbi:Thiol:disulfide interchange protein DsbD precursor [Botrimarina colliarenosi]|uniref:Thiol:disulfide interchange protein DsbD n=1 Tax=Botrimarina colliarenosi TaxID=2528001 RepID=A0A5C6AID0_9BACT|nr:thioredoxin family protein [Botrimarina colliarenosi]TWT99389.1 Thiol:disulfide interchange protein DsbD precursor [Botrimarina colliarenosi]